MSGNYTRYDLWVDGANGGTRWKLDREINTRKKAKAEAARIIRGLPRGPDKEWILYEVHNKVLARA